MASIWESEDLAKYLCGIDRDKEVDTIELDAALYDRFRIEFVEFTEIADALMPLAHRETSPLSGITYRGFAADGTWLRQEPVEAPAQEADAEETDG